ncbi:MAG: MFS transporter [Steroidobacteraceae bacterium]
MTQRSLPRDAWLLCFSAFSADLGYQGVTALFPLYLIFQLHASLYAYGVVTAIAFGGGAFVAYLGGLAGDRFDRKRVAIAGNLFIPLMALAGLAHTVGLAALLYVLGWWARYFRSPPRRALLVSATPPQERTRAFGILHALDIGGGMLSALIVLAALWLKVPVATVMLWAVVPLAVSTGLLLLVRRREVYLQQTPAPSSTDAPRTPPRGVLGALLISATLYGFSFYNLGFPIVTAAETHAARGYEWGVLAYVVYLGISALSGYALGNRRGSCARALWLFGYLPSALGSGLIALSVAWGLHALAFYLAVGVLGFGMGAVETFEPALVASLIGHTRLGRGMGFLSVSRAVGQFLSNLIMGVLFGVGRAAPYGYAFASALLAALIFGAVDLRGGRRS